MKDIKLKAAQFQMDCGDEELPILFGYYDSNKRYWNGFANPYLDRANRDAWIAFSKIFYEGDVAKEMETIEPQWIDGKYLYYFGGGYTWHERSI